MADVQAAIEDWSVTASSNLPADATTLGAGLADNLQQIQATTRAAYSHKGSDIASATTPDIGAVAGAYHDITGTTTITGLGTVSAGIRKVLQFDGALTLTHNASSLILPGGANITTAAGDHGEFMSLGSGNWVCLWYAPATGKPVVDVDAAEPVNHLCTGRLTLSSGNPVADATNGTTMYYTPYGGAWISLYDGSAWTAHAFAEISLAVPADTNTNHDVWVYDDSGTLKLETTAWTNATTRATALAFQDGVYVKSGTATRRYVGTIRTTSSSGTTTNELAKRFVWNYYNRIETALYKIDGTASWDYTAATWRPMNNDADNQVAIVSGVAEDGFYITANVVASNSSTVVVASNGIGRDSTSSPISGGRRNQAHLDALSGHTSGLTAFLDNSPVLGYHYYTALEHSTTEGGITTWYGNNGLGGTFKC